MPQVEISKGRCGKDMFCNISLSFPSEFCLYLLLLFKWISGSVPAGDLQLERKQICQNSKTSKKGSDSRKSLVWIYWEKKERELERGGQRLISYEKPRFPKSRRWGPALCSWQHREVEGASAEVGVWHFLTPGTKLDTKTTGQIVTWPGATYLWAATRHTAETRPTQCLDVSPVRSPNLAQTCWSWWRSSKNGWVLCPLAQGGKGLERLKW